jgi:hypothetical protein
MNDLAEHLDRLLREVRAESNSVRIYAAEIMADLAAAVGEPGYNEALLAARDAIALRAGVSAVDSADAADREVLGLIYGFLAGGVR